MDPKQTETQISLLLNQKAILQKHIATKKEDMDRTQNEIDNIEAQMINIDKKISNINLQAQKQNPQEKPENKPNVEEVEEDASAGITTGSLDANSTSSDGSKGGWRYYPKIGDTVKRKKYSENTGFAKYLNSFSS